MIIEGLINKRWALKNPQDMSAPVILDYLQEKSGVKRPPEQAGVATPTKRPAVHRTPEQPGVATPNQPMVTFNTDNPSGVVPPTNLTGVDEANTQSRGNRLTLTMQRQLQRLSRQTH